MCDLFKSKINWNNKSFCEIKRPYKTKGREQNEKSYRFALTCYYFALNCNEFVLIWFAFSAFSFGWRCVYAIWPFKKSYTTPLEPPIHYLKCVNRYVSVSEQTCAHKCLYVGHVIHFCCYYFSNNFFFLSL